MDVNELLEPIDKTSPCGLDLRLIDNKNNIYYELRENRNQARMFERKQISSENTTSIPYTQTNEYWNIILINVPLVLKEQTKDLEIGCWLLEANVRKFGFEGLAEGLLLLNQLCNYYWNELYPSIENEDVENRISPICGLNGYSSEGALIAPIYMLSIVPETASEKLSTWDFLQAIELEKQNNPSVRKERQNTGVRSLEELRHVIKSSDKSFYNNLLDTITIAQENLDLLKSSLERFCKEQAPSLNFIKEALNNVDLAVTTLTKSLFKSKEFNATESDLIDIKQEEFVVNDSNLSSREEALLKLEQVADYFYINEPHSPISYIIRKAIRWSKMDLMEMLPELIRDQNAQYDFSWLIGLEPKFEQDYAQGQDHLED